MKEYHDATTGARGTSEFFLPAAMAFRCVRRVLKKRRIPLAEQLRIVARLCDLSLGPPAPVVLEVAR